MYWLSLGLAGLVALFTGLYWWDTKRSFLLELDRVVLWYRLEEKKWLDKEKISKGIDKICKRHNWPAKQTENLKKGWLEDLMVRELVSELAFFRTLKSKGLENRLEKYGKEQEKMLSDYYKNMGRKPEEIKKGDETQ